MNRAWVSLVRDRGPAAAAQDEIAWPSFLMRKGPQLHPHCRRVTPQGELLLELQTFAPIPHRSIHLHPSYSNSTCSFGLCCGTTRSAKVFPPEWWSNATTSLIRGSLDPFSRPPALGGMMKASTLQTLQNESRERRSFKKSILLKFFFFFFTGLSPRRICVSVSINTLKKSHSSPAAFSFSWFRCPLGRRKEERKHRPQTELQLLHPGFFQHVH